MKKSTRILGVFLCLVMLFSVNVFAAEAPADTPAIDVSTAANGCFTVNYADGVTTKMKVAVTFDGQTTFYNYTPGTVSSYTFANGDGDYTVTLYRNVGGTSYKPVTSVKAQVKLSDSLDLYRVSTAEISFSATDAVGMKAAELCAGLTDDSAKIVAINNYMAANFVYDYDFAAAVNAGTVKNYVPNTSAILEAKKGICYDMASLFAAMCRSQGIPCAVAKGYYNGVAHAWNMVYLNGEWIPMDMVASIAHKTVSATTVAECIIDLVTEGYYGYSF